MRRAIECIWGLGKQLRIEINVERNSEASSDLFLDIFLSHDLYSLTMVEGANWHRKAHSACAAERQVLTNFTEKKTKIRLFIQRAAFSAPL